MNEKEIERLFEGYRDSLGTCGREFVIVPKRWPRLRLGWAFAAGAALALTGGLALWPRDAAAGAVRRMEKAILNARTMEMVYEHRKSPGAWRVFDHEYARDGMWRYDSGQGTPREATFILRDEKTIADYRRLDHATIAWGDRFEFDGVKSALGFARASIDAGWEGSERKLAVRSHAPVGGVPTYVLTIDRAEDDYHGEILVDARNDLPISSKYSRPDDGGDGVWDYRQTYRFNAPLPDALFEPSKAKPLIDVPRAVADLERRWEKPLARVGDAAVRDACATEDGTVWVTVTIPNGKEPTLPTEIVGAKPYARLRDLSPAAIIAGYRPIRMFGDQVLIVGFVPLDPGMRQDDKIVVRLAPRERGLEGWRDSGALPKGPGEAIALPLRRVPGDRPEHFTALLLDDFGLQLEPSVLGARAEGLKKAGRVSEAARAYEACGISWGRLSQRYGATRLKEAAKLYDEIGKNADAVRARAGATALLAEWARKWAP